MATVKTSLSNFPQLVYPGLQKILYNEIHREVTNITNQIVENVTQQLFDKFKVTVQELDFCDGQKPTIILEVNFK